MALHIARDIKVSLKSCFLGFNIYKFRNYGFGVKEGLGFEVYGLQLITWHCTLLGILESVSGHAF